MRLKNRFSTVSLVLLTTQVFSNLNAFADVPVTLLHGTAKGVNISVSGEFLVHRCGTMTVRSKISDAFHSTVIVGKAADSCSVADLKEEYRDYPLLLEGWDWNSVRFSRISKNLEALNATQAQCVTRQLSELNDALEQEPTRLYLKKRNITHIQIAFSYGTESSLNFRPEPSIDRATFVVPVTLTSTGQCTTISKIYLIEQGRIENEKEKAQTLTEKALINELNNILQTLNGNDAAVSSRGQTDQRTSTKAPAGPGTGTENSSETSLASGARG